MIDDEDYEKLWLVLLEKLRQGGGIILRVNCFGYMYYAYKAVNLDRLEGGGNFIGLMI